MPARCSLNCPRSFLVVRSLALLAIAACLQSEPAGAEGIPFETAPRVGGSASDMAVVDLNADGRPDLVTSSGNVSVQLGTGDGAFAAAVVVATQVRGFEIGDMDGDGRLDLVTQELDGFAVYAGDGQGAFTLLGRRRTGTTVGQHLVADLNDDGRADVIMFVLARRGSWAYWLDVYVSGTGGGLHRRLPVRLQGEPVAATLAYLEEGGTPRLLLTTSEAPDRVMILRGNCAGDFLETWPLELEHDVRWIQADDLDGDGSLEIMTAGGSVGISRLDGAGRQRTIYHRTHGVTSIATLDADGDGDRDLVAARPSSGIVHLFENNGAGVLRDRGSFQGSSAGSQFAAPLAGVDLDDDGRDDVVHGGSAVRVLMASDRHQLAAPRAMQLGSIAFVHAHGDFDRDGRVDIVGVSGLRDRSVHLARLGNRRSRLAPVSALGFSTSGLVAGDFDGDGALDLASSDDGRLAVYAGFGDGRFGPERIVVEEFAVPHAVADLDGNGQDDLIVHSTNPEVLQTWLADGRTFTLATQVELPDDFLFYLRDLSSGDYDGDGNPDVAYTDPLALEVRLLYGDGAGGFAAERGVSIGDPSHIVSGDLNGDGTDDLVVRAEGLAKGLPSMTVLLSGPGRGVRHAETLHAESRPLLIADLDQDGFGDIVCRGPYDSITIFRSDGKGGLGPTSRIATGEGPSYAIATDLTGDGYPDLIFGNTNSRTITVSRNLLGER